MKFERVNSIWKYLRQKNTHTTKKIIKWGLDNGISDPQLRRDLHILQSLGYIEINYGHINVLATETEVDSVKKAYKIENRNSKEIIAMKAVELLSENDQIFCSSGTTIQSFIVNINKNVKTFITNGLDTFVSAKKSNFIKNKILIGGDWCLDNSSFVGSMAEDQIKLFNFNKAFISCDHIDEDFNLYVDNYRESKIISQVLKNSGTVYLLVDCSKFNKKGLVGFTKMEGINFIVTDKPLPSNYVDLTKCHNVKVI